MQDIDEADAPLDEATREKAIRGELPELTGTSFSFAAITEFSVDSTMCGGDMKRSIG